MSRMKHAAAAALATVATDTASNVTQDAAARGTHEGAA